ncbi:MBL fold metallo-hydrolase [Candidatus Bathyarchaeota archaeon]|nr:MAG: MBL fold metallo-hydrolase [Candidatus Bathyarchaeota archaeon]
MVCSGKMAGKNGGDLIVPRKWYKILPRESWERFEKIETSFPWFEVYELPSEVYALYEPGQFEEVISYLVQGEERAALVDTGNGIGDIKGLVEELTDLPVTVVNTHAHGDHIGMNHAFEEVAIMDTPFSREVSRQGRSHESMAHFLEEGMVWKPLPDGFDPANYHVSPFEVTRWLRDGDEIDLGGRRLEAIHTPGHSPDSACLLDRGAGLFWTGDIFYNAPLYVYAANTDLDQFVESYGKMVDLFPHYDRLLPSHNETWVEKGILRRVLEAARSIRAGEAGEFREGVRNGIPIRRYDYEGFALIVRAP